MRSTLLTAAFLLLIVLGVRALPKAEVLNPTIVPQLSAAAAADPAAATSPSSARTYSVTKVIDGDTLIIDMDGTRTTLRLIGLDTPETVDPRKPVQCFGAEASAKAKQLLEGARVALEYDSSQGELDKYGRTLAYVRLEDGTLFNEYMIAEGYGHEYTYALPYKYQAAFRAAESDAREKKKGLWADDACADVRAPQTKVSAGAYVCDRNAYNCSDFAKRSEAQAAFDACGPTDVHKLDSNGDGEVCESLP